VNAAAVALASAAGLAGSVFDQRRIAASAWPHLLGTALLDAGAALSHAR
jgi:hypothetical protein